MKNGTMFGELKNYLNEDYFYSHQNIYLTTSYENTIWKIFSFYISDINFEYTKINFNDNSEFLEFLNLVHSKSIFNTETELTSEDKIITLSTCTNKRPNERFVLHAKLIN